MTSPIAGTGTVPWTDLRDADSPTWAEEDGRVRLLGSRCPDCGTPYYPIRRVCAACDCTTLDAQSHGPGARLYSATTVHTGAEPSHLAYLDVDGGVRVLARLRDAEAPLDAPGTLVTDRAHGWIFIATDDPEISS